MSYKTTINNKRKNRQGTVVPLIAVMLPLFIALIAFAVDYGVIVISRHELQNAADAASIATLQTLLANHDEADLAAYTTLTANLFHGKPIVFDMQLDVHYGTWDSETRQFTQIDRTQTVASTGDTSGSTIPSGASAVRVRLTRSVERGNGVKLFFAQLLGTTFVDINVEAVSASSGGCNGFVGLDSVRIHNRAKTDSYNSNEGDYGTGGVYQNGDVCSNGEVLLDYSSATINGDAEGNPVTIREYSQGTITGTQSTATGTRVEDAVDFSQTKNNNNNDNIPLRGPNDYRGTSYVDSNGDFILDGGQTLALSAGTYHFRDMTVEGGGKLETNGKVTIYIERELKYNNGTFNNLTAAPSNLNLLVGAGPVGFQGGTQLHAVLYAPQAAITIENNARFSGSIIGKSLVVGGGAELHLDESLATDAEGGGPPSLVN